DSAPLAPEGQWPSTHRELCEIIGAPYGRLPGGITRVRQSRSRAVCLCETRRGGGPHGQAAMEPISGYSSALYAPPPQGWAEHARGLWQPAGPREAPGG